MIYGDSITLVAFFGIKMLFLNNNVTLVNEPAQPVRNVPVYFTFFIPESNTTIGHLYNYEIDIGLKLETWEKIVTKDYALELLTHYDVVIFNYGIHYWKDHARYNDNN